MRVPFPAFPARCQLADLPFAPAGTTRADGGGAALASSSSSSSSLAPAATTNLQPVPFATGDGAMAAEGETVRFETTFPLLEVKMWVLGIDFAKRYQLSTSAQSLLTILGGC